MTDLHKKQKRRKSRRLSGRKNEALENSVRSRMCKTIVIMTTLPWATSAFVNQNGNMMNRGHGVPLCVKGNTEDGINAVTVLEGGPWDLNATSDQSSARRSIGSLLMQMQKQELQGGSSKNGTAWTDDPLTLDPETVHAENTKTNATSEEDDDLSASSFSPSDELSRMDAETARALDDSITWMESTSATHSNFISSVDILPLPTIYNASKQTDQQQRTDVVGVGGAPTKASIKQPLSMPEHYRDRIGRDMRHLAVSIVSSVENVDQWRFYYEQNSGGIMPLLECIREGVRSIHYHKQINVESDDLLSSGFLEANEESFIAACSACRALRDLCAISPELSAVTTDSILRANAVQKWPANSGLPTTGNNDYYDGNLMSDFMSMLRYAHEYSEKNSSSPTGPTNPFRRIRNERDARLRCKLYVTQLLLAMTVSSDDAVDAIRATDGLEEAIIKCSSYTLSERSRRWLRYPGEMFKFWRTRKTTKSRRRPFLEAATVENNLDGQVRKTSNQVLAAIGCNRWVPKIPGQRGLRILCMDGGGARGMVACSLVKGMVEQLSGLEVSDCFDIISGTSTGGIISFLNGLRRESSTRVVERYNELIKQIFVKSALSTPMMLFTTATYDESPFMGILSNILKDDIMLDSRSDPAVPLVFCVASKMSSTPSQVALFRNYNYGGGELKDPFTIDPDKARQDLRLGLELEDQLIQKSSYEKRTNPSENDAYMPVKRGSSRNPGSFRVLQRYALRASTAAPTFFKPVMMGGEMYCDGGIVASNPTAIAIHEARAIFPDIPIELVVSIGTGGFQEQKSEPRIGWDGIIGQIVNSATDAEQIHQVLEDILGGDGLGYSSTRSHVSQTKYYRFNPVLGLPDEYPIDVTEPEKLEKLKEIAYDYLQEPEQKKRLAEINDILRGRRWRKWVPWAKKKKL